MRCKFALTVALLVSSSALAGTFEVKPTSVSLDDNRAPGSVSVINTGKESVRFQVKAVAWTQNERGEMALSPTKDVVVYPSLFTVPAGSTQSVRVAVVAQRGAKERAYRILVEELPSPRPESERTGNEIRVLMHMGIPVFLAPSSASKFAGSVEAALDGGKVHITARNQGSIHVRVGQVRVSGPHFERTVAGWYVLPGDTQVYDVAVPSCGNGEQLKIEASTDRGTWTRSIACRPVR